MNHDPKAHDDTNATPPDSVTSGDVSTTGYPAHDAPPGAGATVDETAHTTGGHGGHVDDTSDVSTLVPVTWRQLIFPAIIVLIVAILVAGPVTDAFAPHPAAPPPAQTTIGEGTSNAAAPTAIAQPQVVATATSPATAEPTGTTPPPVTPTTSGLSPDVIATRTAVAVAGASGDVERAPVQLDFGGSTFAVKPGGSGLLPDWKPPQDEATATWIDGTFANHVIYLPYTAQNDALFKNAHPGDLVKLTMNTGQIFSFQVTRADRATNGPSTVQGQFTVPSAMAQDHAGVTLFLVGDPAPDRAVVQADFTGTIQ
jgi:hypothetical protein